MITLDLNFDKISSENLSIFDSRVLNMETQPLIRRYLLELKITMGWLQGKYSSGSFPVYAIVSIFQEFNQNTSEYKFEIERLQIDSDDLHHSKYISLPINQIYNNDEVEKMMFTDADELTISRIVEQEIIKLKKEK